MSATGAAVQHAVAFADGDGGGNPCPVVTGADGWTDARMQAAAAAFGHETCFVLAPRAGGDVRLRYFVPRHEMEMCVHATVAATLLLARAGRVPAALAHVETPLGVRRVWHDDSEALVEQFAPELEALWALCDRLGVTGVYAFTLHARGADAAARQFPLRAGYDEDPATGVAACALAAHLADGAPDGWHAWRVAQGRAMGRPSRIDARVLRADGATTATRVGGGAVAHGEPAPLA